MTIKVFLCCALLTALFVPAVMADDTAPPVIYSLKGTVLSNSREPVASVWVLLVDDNKTVLGKSLTGDDGKYYLEFLQPGTYRLMLSKDIDRKQPLGWLPVTLTAVKTKKDVILKP